MDNQQWTRKSLRLFIILAAATVALTWMICFHEGQDSKGIIPLLVIWVIAYVDYRLARQKGE